MKILNFGVDNSIIDQNSSLAQRVRDYSQLVDRYDIVVISENDKVVDLFPRTTIRGVATKNKIFGFFHFFKISYGIVEKKKYDIITVQDPYFLALVGLILAKKFKIGLEIQVHGWEKFGGLRKIVAKYVLPRADAIRTVSQRLKKQLINEFKVKEKKITVVPIYVEILDLKSQISKTKKVDEKFIFLTAGRLVPVKNIGLQIEAMAEIVKKYPETKLWIVGEGKERKNLEFRIKNYELGSNIKLFGWQKNLDKFYNQADAFLLTSNYEGWGMVIIEAASYGLPIIMTDVGCAGEIIKNNESGIVIPVGDKEKLVKTMAEVMENRELRKKLGQGAKTSVEKLPTKEETLNLYKESWEKAMHNI